MAVGLVGAAVASEVRFVDEFDLSGSTCGLGKRTLARQSVVDPAATAQLGILTPPERPEPRINGADVWGERPGHPVIFRMRRNSSSCVPSTVHGATATESRKGIDKVVSSI